jgi:hypothetical protein
MANRQRENQKMKSVKTVAAGVIGAGILASGLAVSIAKAQGVNWEFIQVGALAFQPYDTATTRNCNSNGYYCYLDSPGTLVAMVPSSIADGTELLTVNCDVRDSSATGSISVRLVKLNAVYTGESSTNLGESADDFNDSAWHQVGYFGDGVVLDRREADYAIMVNFSESGSNLRLQGCRIYYIEE